MSPIRTVEELKSTVSEILEDLVHDGTSHLSKLDKVWEQVVKPIIIKELVSYWQKVARLGRTLEEAARLNLSIALHNLPGRRVMGKTMKSAIAGVLKAIPILQSW